MLGALTCILTIGSTRQGRYIKWKFVISHSLPQPRDATRSMKHDSTHDESFDGNREFMYA